ncbi:MAG: hypothetical protein CSA33_03670 [Desulfobulbus propionicus]|nr:MAG: hypothetical protein CSA33_03670 [Desulfobulbus propionicus]
MVGEQPNPGFSSAQVPPGSVVFATSFYVDLCVAKRLPKMASPARTFGDHESKCEPIQGQHIPLFGTFFSKQTKCT